MIEFTGHRLDAVVELTVDDDAVVERLLQRAAIEGRADDTEDVIRRRQEVYAEQTAPLIDVYRDRGILIEVDGLGEVDEVTSALAHRVMPSGSAVSTSQSCPRELDALGLPARPDGPSATAASRSRAATRSTRCGSPDCSSARPSSCCGPPSARASPPAELDKLAEDHIRSHGGVPSFLGYGHPPFPGTICASVNDEVVHGIPGERVLAEGDVISIDCGAIVDGWHGDAAITVAWAVGDGSRRGAPADARSPRSHCGAAWPRRGWAAGSATSRTRLRVHVRSQGDYGILEDYVGHGIGTAMHQPPNVPNVGRPGRGPKLVEGLALAVEPMVTLGGKETDLAEDEWTVATSDGSMAAHFEHTFTLTPNGPWVLTALDGGEARLTELGVPFGGR